jgi:hypothetical protein
MLYTAVPNQPSEQSTFIWYKALHHQIYIQLELIYVVTSSLIVASSKHSCSRWKRSIPEYNNRQSIKNFLNFFFSFHSTLCYILVVIQIRSQGKIKLLKTRNLFIVMRSNTCTFHTACVKPPTADHHYRRHPHSSTSALYQLAPPHPDHSGSQGSLLVSSYNMYKQG